MKITVLQRAIEEEKFSKDGVERMFRKQWCELENDGLRTSFTVSIFEGSEPYKPGEYELDPSSFGVQRGGLILERVKLRAVAARKAA